MDSNVVSELERINILKSIHPTPLGCSIIITTFLYLPLQLLLVT